MTGQGPIRLFTSSPCEHSVVLTPCGSGTLRLQPKGRRAGGPVNSRMSIAAALAVSALVLVAPGAASASVGVSNPVAFTSNGTVSGGWTWVHDDTHTASWTFNMGTLEGAQAGTVRLNVNALVSNRVDGGAGFSASSVRFVARCGSTRQVLKVKLVNPFRPIVPGDSLGLGWTAMGHSSQPLRVARFAGCAQIEVTIGGPYAQQRAIGFIPASLKFGYR